MKRTANRTSQSRRQSRRARLSTYLGLLVSACCIVWLFHMIDVEQIFRTVRNVSPGHLLIALLALIMSYLIRSWRWRYFFRAQAPNFSDSFRCLILGFFMNNVLPARLGEFVRAQLGGRATKLSRAHVLGTIAAERLADGVAISVVFGVLFSFASRPEEIAQGQAILYVANLFMAASFATALILYKQQLIFHCLEKLDALLPGSFSTYTLVRVRRFLEGLDALKNPRKFIAMTLLSGVVWTVELISYSQVAEAFGQTLSLGGLGLFLAAANYSSLIPAAPGGIGVIEAFTSMALVKIGVGHEEALAMVAAQHALQILVVGIPGAYFFFTRVRGSVDLDSENEDESQGSVESGAVPVSRPGEAAGVKLSVVIPAFHEEKRLPPTVRRLTEYLDRRGESYEIIVVDDGSRDNTSKTVVQNPAFGRTLKLLVNPRNRGKGYSVRFGVLNACGEYVLLYDADGATPIEELQRLELEMEKGADVVIGSRALFAEDTKVSTLWYRKFLGRIFNGCVNVFLVPKIADTQCGFKLFRAAAAQQLFRLQRAERFSFDIEILFLAQRQGLVIREVPINWENVPGSKVNLLSDSFSMFLDIFRIRFRYNRGGYALLEQKHSHLPRSASVQTETAPSIAGK